MFIHVVKDYMKKLEDIDARLAVSLDKDEIQTLGLKLRFFYNEIRHYRTLLDGLYEKIIETQEKYGFKPEEPRPERAAETQWQPPPEETEAGAESPDVMEVLKQWVTNLQDKGYTPEELLAAAGVGPEEMAAAQQLAPPDEIPGIAPAAPMTASAPADVIAPVAAPARAAPAVAVAVPRAQPQAPAPQEPAAFEMPRGVAPAIPVAAHAASEATPAPPSPVIEQISQAVAPEPPEAPAPPREFITPEIFEVVETQLPEPAPAAPRPSEPDPLSAPFEDLLTHWSEKYRDADKFSPGLQSCLDALLQRRRAEVIVALDKLVERIKANPAALDLPPLTLFLFGHLALALGRHGLTINLLEKAVSDGIGYAVCFLNLAQCYTAKNVPAKALINYKFASRVDPDLAAATLGIAESLIGMGQNEEGLEYINAQKFRTETEQVRSVLLKSRALESLDRRTEAEKLLERLAGVCESPRNRALCLFRLGRIHEEKKDVLRAIDYFEDTVAADPDNLEARFNLGRLYTQHQAFPLAKKHLQYLCATHPDTKWADRARELL